jgi:3-deoxy-7-phosphoheptulonate synthase
MILRGGRNGVNYSASSVAEACAQLERAGVAPQVMIDCSHANSHKDHTKQGIVCRDVARQITNGERRLIGVMLESNLVAGAQQLIEGQPLAYGQSITDACIGWGETLGLLRVLARATLFGR